MDTAFRRRGALFLSIFLTCLAVSASAKCDKYEPRPNQESVDGNPYTALASTVRISEIVNCTGTKLGTQIDWKGLSGSIQSCNATQCALASPQDFFVKSESYLNISIPNEDSYTSIMELVKTSTPHVRPVDFNRTMVHKLSATGTCIAQGRTSYWSFTPMFLCTEGVLTGCSGNGLADVTRIKACGVVLLQSTDYDGRIGIVETSGNSAPAPPNATATTTASPANFASSVRSSASLAGWAAATVMFMFML